MVQWEVSQWLLLAATFMPILVGIITKSGLSSGGKAVTLIVLDAIAVVLTDWQATPDGFVFSDALFQLVVSVAISVALYFGVWKPTISPAVNSATENFGIGPSTPRARAA
jgi:hypothetical protein